MLYLTVVLIVIPLQKRFKSIQLDKMFNFPFVNATPHWVGTSVWWGAWRMDDVMLCDLGPWQAKQDTESNTLTPALNTVGPGLLKYLQHCKGQGKLGNTERHSYVLNVGKSGDGSVFISSPQKFGSHRTAALVELKEGIILHCESLGLDLPSELVQRVGPLLNLFGKEPVPCGPFVWLMSKHLRASCTRAPRCP